MSISVKSTIKKLINDKMKSLGFKCKDNIYYRLINGVLQGIKIYSIDMQYTIRFGCYPLCGGMEKNPGVFESHGITDILPQSRDEFFNIIPWGANITEEMQIEAWKNRETKYVEIANQLVDELNRYLLPQLLEITSPQDAFEFEKKCYISRIMYGYKMSFEEAEDIYNKHYTTIHYNWHLQMKNYEEAKLCLQKRIEELKEYSRQNNREIDTSFLEIPYGYLVEENYDAIEKYIEEKENITIKSFALKR